MADFNHDRKIDDQDRASSSARAKNLETGDPNRFFFWTNDDNDSGDTGGDDIPGSATPNYADAAINGVRDLVDFFPVWLDIKPLLDLLPPEGCDYCLVNADGALNFTETQLRANVDETINAGAYLTDVGAARLASAGATHQITAAGVNLSLQYLNQIRGDASRQSGIILVEGRKETKADLKLEVRAHANGQKLAELKLPLSIGKVESMYRQKNLRYLAGNNEGAPDYKASPGEEPTNYPDRLCNGKKFVFVHGYSVSGEAARGWGAETFKRLYWSGSRARFYTVTWFGNETQGTVPGYPDATPDYHANVNNAFSAGRWLANYLTSIGGADVAAGHSLGNMVISSAIQDWNAPVGQYYLIDAAVAAESYSQDESKNTNMAHPNWVENGSAYAERLWASEWHSLFASSDNRSRLTWRDRFAAVGVQAYNFFSSTEEVLAEHAGNPDIMLGNPNIPLLALRSGICSWALQEKLKGRSDLPGLRCNYGGWGFNSYYDHVVYDNGVEISRRRATAAEAALIPLADLQAKPFFDVDAFAGPAMYAPATGRDFASPAQNRNRLLAEMMPARTLAAGRTAVKGVANARNFDMSSESFRNGWPQDRIDDRNLRWQHSDLRQVAYLYVYKLYEQFKTLGNLDQ